jgi:hypothetical protein
MLHCEKLHYCASAQPVHPPVHRQPDAPESVVAGSCSGMRRVVGAQLSLAHGCRVSCKDGRAEMVVKWAPAF